MYDDLAGRPVIIGSGLAGLMTALDLAPLPCVLVTAGALGAATSSDLAQGGLAAAIGPDDSPELHAADTLAAGAGLCDPAVVARITAAGPAAVSRLVGLGARLDHDETGAPRLGLEGAHSRRRIVHARGDGTGHELTRAAVAAVRATPSITVLEHALVTRVLVDGGRVVGVDLVDVTGGHRVGTSYVVLATGGAGALFAHTTNPTGSWGSGLALGLRAGAAVRDLEMVQFHPTGLDVGGDPMPLVSEAVRGEGAHLVTERGARLVADDLAARDVVSRAVWSALSRGQKVHLDTPALGPGFAAHFPTVTALAAAAGLDPSVDRLPVRPTAHYHMGGLLVDDQCRTTVPGLWAVGEVSSTGLHGANRLASNSLLEAVVCAGWVASSITAAVHPQDRADMANRADMADHADRAAATRGAHGVVADSILADSVLADRTLADSALADRTLADRVLADRTLAKSVVAYRGVRAPAQRPSLAQRTLLEAAAGVVRDQSRLSAAVRTLRPDAEADDASLVALLLAWSALHRTESRGAHTRSDYPATSAPRHTVTTMTEALAAIDAVDDTLTHRSA